MGLLLRLAAHADDGDAGRNAGKHGKNHTDNGHAGLGEVLAEPFQSVQVGFDRSVLAQDPVADLDREFDSYEQFKREPYAYIVHWNTRRRQIRLEGHIPKEFRNMSLTV